MGKNELIFQLTIKGALILTLSIGGRANYIKNQEGQNQGCKDYRKASLNTQELLKLKKEYLTEGKVEFQSPINLIKMGLIS